MKKVIISDPESGYEVREVDTFIKGMARRYPESVRIVDIPDAILLQWEQAQRALRAATLEIDALFVRAGQ